MEESLLLKKVRRKEISPEAFLTELWQLSKGLSRKGRTYQPYEVRMYRARVFNNNGDKPKNISQLSYPLVCTSTDMQRAGNLFYASAGLPTTFVEKKVDKGQYVAVSEWVNTKAMVFQEVGFLENGLNTNGSQEQEKICNEIFTSRDDGLKDYSAKVADHLLGGEGIVGLLYPSVMANQSHNIALKKKFVDEGLQFINATFYFVEDIISVHSYRVNEIDFALPIGDNLDWKNRKKQWVIRENGGQLKMVSTGWGYDAYSPDGKLVRPE